MWRNNRFRLLVMVFSNVAVISLLSGCGKNEQEQATSNKQETERPAERAIITGEDDGHKWREVSYEARVNLCKDLAQRIGKHDWEYYYVGIDTFYNTSNADVLREQITDVAYMMSSIPSDKEMNEAINEATSQGFISSRDRKIYDFLESRWDFYEKRDGTYIPEKHDDVAFSEAAKTFGISKDEVMKIYYRIAEISAGIKPKEQIELDSENAAVELMIKKIRVLRDNSLEVTVENRTQKRVTLPTMNLTFYLFQGTKKVGSQIVWLEDLGYGETKVYASPNIEERFDAIEAIVYMNIDEINTMGLKSRIQPSNDPGETVIPVLRIKRQKVR
jgi:hypothetical protein